MGQSTQQPTAEDWAQFTEADNERRQAVARGIESVVGAGPLTALEEYVVWVETDIFLDFFHGVGIGDVKKLELAEEYARMLVDEPHRLKVLAAYYLENTVHDRWVVGGILDCAVDQAIGMLMPYVRESQPRWVRVILDRESVTDDS